MSLLHKILEWDRFLFHKLNGEWTNSFFDLILPPARNAQVWIPFYVALVAFAIIKYKRTGLFWILLGIATVATSDMISSHLIKGAIFRMRPCHDTSLVSPARFLVKYCPVSSSFTSSHAANHFALAMFIFSTLKNQAGKWLWFIFLWAFTIAYAQVYVGVHFPLDILAGGLLGCLIGYVWAKVFHRFFSFPSRHIESNRKI